MKKIKNKEHLMLLNYLKYINEIDDNLKYEQIPVIVYELTKNRELNEKQFKCVLNVLKSMSELKKSLI